MRISKRLRKSRRRSSKTNRRNNRSQKRGRRTQKRGKRTQRARRSRRRQNKRLGGNQGWDRLVGVGHESKDRTIPEEIRDKHMKGAEVFEFTGTK